MSEATPKDMPGAGAETEPSTQAAAEVTAEPVEVKSEPAPKPTETVDFWKSKARQHEDRAKSNFEDAQKWRELREKAGGKDDFDPRSEIDAIRADLKAERLARWRAEVARATDVDPEDIKGETEEEMRESAERWKQRFEARLDAALKSKKTAPAAAPAAEVTSDAKVSGPKQLSRDELKNMTRQQRLDAYKNGQVDALIGRTD